MIRSPLLPSSHAFRLDNTLASNAYEAREPLQSIAVADTYNVESDCAEADMALATEPDHPPKHYKSQLQNQAPRYRTMLHDSRPNAKMLNRNPPPRQRPARHNSDLITPPPPFLSNATGHTSTFRGLSNIPYLSNPKPQPLIPTRPTNNFYDSQIFWLGLYFIFNLGLTLFNKGVLLRFPFPYTLTALHALCGSIGGYIMLETGLFVPARLGTKETISLIAFSVIYAVNIMVSNVSLHLVTVPFHQVIRASTPIFTIALSASLLGVSSSPKKLLSLVPVILGVALATYGDYYFTTWGLILTLLGTFLAALKTIYTNILQSRTSLSHRASFSPFLPPRLHLHPLDLLIRMAPLAFIQCVLYAYVSGELDHVRHYSAHEMTPFKATALLANGAIAFGLNVVSFTANKKAGALSMTVAGNVKQVLTILFAVTIFDLTITNTNALGILLTLSGGAWYAMVDYQEKRSHKHRA